MHTHAETDALNSFEGSGDGAYSEGQRGEKKRRKPAVFVTTTRSLLQKCDNGLVLFQIARVRQGLLAIVATGVTVLGLQIAMLLG
jgi:hypothetical protein